MIIVTINILYEWYFVNIIAKNQQYIRKRSFLLAKLTNGCILYDYKKSSGEVDTAIHLRGSFLKREEYTKMQ